MEGMAGRKCGFGIEQSAADAALGLYGLGDKRGIGNEESSPIAADLIVENLAEELGAIGSIVGVLLVQNIIIELGQLPIREAHSFDIGAVLPKKVAAKANHWRIGGIVKQGAVAVGRQKMPKSAGLGGSRAADNMMRRIGRGFEQRANLVDDRRQRKLLSRLAELGQIGIKIGQM